MPLTLWQQYERAARPAGCLSLLVGVVLLPIIGAGVVFSPGPYLLVLIIPFIVGLLLITRFKPALIIALPLLVFELLMLGWAFIQFDAWGTITDLLLNRYPVQLW